MTPTPEQIHLAADMIENPNYLPWTLETCPRYTTQVKRKDERKLSIIGQWSERDALVLGRGIVSYENLFNNYTTRDGKPCGSPKIPVMQYFFSGSLLHKAGWYDTGTGPWSEKVFIRASFDWRVKPT